MIYGFTRRIELKARMFHAGFACFSLFSLSLPLSAALFLYRLLMLVFLSISIFFYFCPFQLVCEKNGVFIVSIFHALLALAKTICELNVIIKCLCVCGSHIKYSK